MSTASETIRLINSRTAIEAAGYAIICCTADRCNLFRQHGMENAVCITDATQAKLLAMFTTQALLPEDPDHYDQTVNATDILLRHQLQIAICQMPETITTASLSQSIIANINPLKKSA